MIDLGVAIIIPVLNEEKYIEKCINSLIKQSYPFERMDVMVVDGGSLDNTPAIVDRISKIHSNVRLLDNPKRIQAVAFNIGVSHSYAPIVIRLDAHAYYHKDYIGLIVKGLEDREYGNVGGKWIMASQSDSLISKANAIINRMSFAIGGADFRVGNEKKDVETVPFGGFRRETIENVGGMNPCLPRGEDNEYNARILNAGYKILFNPEIIATYYARPTLVSFLKQLYSNGFSIGVLIWSYFRGVNVRHIIPLLFFCSVAAFIILGLWNKIFLWLLIIELAIYFCLNLFFSIREANRSGWKYLTVLPWEIFLIHLTYGYGILIGLIKRKYNYD